MAPELVVVPGGDTFKIFPGGVIAVRAAEFLGPARGTLSTEADALSSTGNVVRDTQQVAAGSPPFLDDTSYGDADDTLVIPAADIGIEDGFNYWVFITYRVEGEWDLANEALLRQCTNLEFQSVAGYGLHGTAGDTEASPNMDERVLCRIPYYAALQLRASGVDTTDTLHFRFFAQEDTTAEWLIDQVVFMPRALSPDWLLNQDIRFGGTAFNTSIVDGADGGDDNGKFTWYPIVNTDEFLEGDSGSSDFQRKADGDDAEYNQRITTANNYILLNSVTDVEASAHGYGLYCARYRGPITYSEDTFDNRTTLPTDNSMGVDEAGYGYAIGLSASSSPPQAFVSGGVAVMRLNQEDTNVNPRWGSPSQAAGALSNNGAELNAYDQWAFSGELEHTAGTIGEGDLRIFSYHSIGDTTWEIRIDLLNKEWELGRWNGTTFTNLGSTHDISSWFTLATPFGFRLEVKRYVLRCRVWESSGGEPGTWDEELFKPTVSGGVQSDYPYGDSVTLARRGYEAHNEFGFQLETGLSGTFPYDMTIHDVKFEHDPYGDPEDMSVRMERPEGTGLGDMVIPWGCAYFVYWGTRDWTDANAGTWKLVFSERVWNDTAAAEIQRAETSFWWFRSVHGGLVSMNWRIADRSGVATRVLVGG